MLLAAAACGGGGGDDGGGGGSSATGGASATSRAGGSGSGSNGGGDGSFTGTAEITYNGTTETFRLEPCVSGTDTSIQGAGENEDRSRYITIEVDGGAGSVAVGDIDSQRSIDVDAKTENLKVSDDGSFTATGEAVVDNASTPFELRGSCTTLNWK
jgi:hypothetical protein